ncbi:MAG: ABC-type transport auxiliary lipoprotein family protein [Wenzhouxiangellaceae bacterium]|nr:ABC-type transport auxiliary lipoprotein family protein [Wenzhouxiangellaceae bacterium]
MNDVRPLRTALAAVLLSLVAACSVLPEPETVRVIPLAVPEPESARAGIDYTLAVPRPVTDAARDDRHVLVRTTSGTLTRYGPVQWPDRLPDAFRLALVRYLRDTGIAPSATGSPASAERVLLLDLRAHELAETPGGLVADIDVEARLLDGDGRLVDRERFRATEPVGALQPARVAAAFSGALADTLPRIAGWLARHGGRPAG